MGKKIHKKQVEDVSHGVKAEALAEIVDERLATKEDIRNLERVTKEDIRNLERVTKEDTRDLKRDMKEMEMRLTIRLGAMMAASIAIVAVLVKLL